MRHPLSLTPSISHLLEERGNRPEPGSATRRPALPQACFASDILGMTLFFVLLGTYLVAHL